MDPSYKLFFRKIILVFDIGTDNFKENNCSPNYNNNAIISNLISTNMTIKRHQPMKLIRNWLNRCSLQLHFSNQLNMP